MTREEHIKWCKQRAIAEMDHSGDPKQAVISMMSDLNKHADTQSSTLQSLCMMQLMQPMSRQQAVNFINGFN